MTQTVKFKEKVMEMRRLQISVYECRNYLKLFELKKMEAQIDVYLDITQALFGDDPEPPGDNDFDIYSTRQAFEQQQDSNKLNK